MIWDLAGNVAEWVDYFNYEEKPTPTVATWYEYNSVIGSTAMPKTNLVPTNTLKSWWTNTWNGATNGIGQYYGGTNSFGGALLRGGDYIYGTGAGVFAANLDPPPSMIGNGIGFRCVFRPSAP